MRNGSSFWRTETKKRYSLAEDDANITISTAFAFGPAIAPGAYMIPL